MTTLELVDQVLSRVGEPNKYNLAGPEIEGIVPVALAKFGDTVAADPMIRELLKKDFSVTVTSGTGSLVAAFTATEPLLIECLPWSQVYGSGAQPLQWLPDRVQLGLDRPRMFAYYTVDKSTLRTRNTDGLLTSMSDTLTISGNYTPLITNVPPVLEDMFVDTVIGLLMPANEQT